MLEKRDVLRAIKGHNWNMVMSSLVRFKETFEWQRLQRFLKQSPSRAVGFVICSILADVLSFLVPLIVLFSLSHLTGTTPPGGDMGSALSQFATPMIAMPVALLFLVIHQALRLFSEVLMRQIDKAYFAAESNAIYGLYSNIPLYREELSDKMRPMWFSKNIARNVRHTSEAMQGQFRMVPQLLAMTVSAVALAAINPIAAIITIPIGLIAGLILTPKSRHIFRHSQAHFEDLLPTFAKDLSGQLNQVYREPSDTELPTDLPTSFDGFLRSRYRLHILRAQFRAVSAIVLGALFLAVIMAATFVARDDGGLDLAQLGVVVLLLIILMNKAGALIGNVGGIVSLFPQIKMSREIEANMEESRRACLDRGTHEDADLWQRLPFLTQVSTNGQFTRFNLLKLLELIEARIESDGKTLPLSEFAFIRNSSLERHLQGVELSADRPHRVLYMFKRLRKSGKRIVIVDWATLREMTLNNIQGLERNYRNLRIIVPTTAKIPQKWKDHLGKKYDLIEDFTLLEDTAGSELIGDFSDD